MRDFREDLRARLRSVVAEYGDAMHRIQASIDASFNELYEVEERFEAEKATVEAMIAMEDRRAMPSASTPVKAMPEATLRDFLTTHIRSSGPIDKLRLQELAAAAGYVENGRAFNMTLQNVANGNSFSKLPDGRFVEGSSAANLFGMAGSAREASMTPM